MLPIVVPKREYFDNKKQEFISFNGGTLNLEHSLISISKWESKWKKPFFSKESKSLEQSIDYIRCMTLNREVDDHIYMELTRADISKVNAYIEDPMTATWIREQPNKGRASSQVITSELIYSWMVSYNIPFECEKWHLNRLLILIRILEIRNTPSKKMSKKAVHEQYRAINAARRAKTGSSG